MIYNLIKKTFLYLVLLSITLSQGERIPISVADMLTTNISEVEETNIRDRIESEISNIRSLQLISYSERDLVLTEIEYQQSCVSQECAAEVGQLLGADYMIMPAVRKDNSSGKYAITFKLIHVETGAIVQGGVLIEDQDLNTINDVKSIIGDMISNIGRKISGEEGEQLFFVDKEQKLFQVLFNINVEGTYVSHSSFSPIQTDGTSAIFKLPSDEYTFRFEKNQYKTVTKLIRVNKDEVYSIELLKDESEIIPYVAPGMISINSEPQGAQISINNQSIGSTPYTGTLNSGNHIVELRLGYYYTESIAFTLEGNGFEEINQPLKPRFGYISINTIPSEANILIDEKPLGLSPLKQYRLLDGKHEISVSKDLYHQMSRIIDVDEGKSQELNIKLDQAFGMLQVVTLNEENADVYIDGIKKGITPYEKLNIASGSYLLEVKKDDFNNYSEEITITDKRLTTRTIPLTSNIGLIKVDGGVGEIYVDDKKVGSGNIELKLKPGSYNIRSEAENYYPNKKDILVRAGDNTNLELKPIPRLGSIAVFVNPDGANNAEVYVDGELKGNAPKVITYTMGERTVEVKHNKYISMTKKVKISEGKTTEVKFEMLDYAGSLEQQFKSSRLLFLASFVGAGYSTYLLGEASASSTDAYGRYNDALSSANAVKYKKLAQKNYKKETLIKSLLASSIITTLYAGIKFASVNIENQKIKDKKELEDAIKYFGNRYNKTFKQLYMRALGSPRYSQYRFQNYIYKMDYSEHPYFGKLRDNKYIFSKGLNSSSLFEVVISSEKMIRIYLNDKKPTGVAITKRRTNIRSAPSALFPPIMKAATGSKFLVIPRVRTGWITIIFGDNGIGYVEDSDVKFLLK